MGGNGPAWKGSPIILILFSAIVVVFAAAASSGALLTFHEPFESSESVGTNGGSLYGGTFVTGVFGNALHLPSSGSLNYPNNGKVSISEGTIVFLFRPQATYNCGMLGIGGLSTANSFGTFLATHPTYGSRHIVTEIRDDNMEYYQAWSHGVYPDTNTWMCIATTWDCDSGFRVYVDGVGGYTESINVCDTFIMSNWINVGHAGWYSDCNGIYDEMKFFDYELSSSEIMDACTSFVVCSGNSDCGDDGLVRSPYCSNNDSYQDYRTWTCNNPGQTNAYCSYTESPQLQKDCGEDSYSSWGNNYCKGSYLYHFRTHYDRGCSVGSCFEIPYMEERLVEICPYGCDNGACIIQCQYNSDCGTDGWLNQYYCSGDNVWDLWRAYTCNNPGTKDSYCSHTDTAQQKEVCDRGCDNGECIGLSEQIQWLASRQDAYPTGLVDSYEGDNHTDISCPPDCPVAFTYDQATSIVAFTHAGEYARARSILDRMEISQNPDGSWWGGLSAQNGDGMLEWRKSSGEAGWMVVAINYYEKETKDTGYQNMKNKALGWLETMIDKNPGHDSYGGICVGNNWWDIPGSAQCYGSDWWQFDEQKAFSTEHNFVCYGAFMGAANLTANLTEKERLEAMAWGMLDYVFREPWAGSYFYRGFRDTEIWLDPHTMAVLALGDEGLHGEDLVLGLDHCKNNMGSQLDFEAGVTVDGFSYNDYSVPIWVEGTGQMATAYYVAGKTANWNYYTSEAGKTVYPSGGVPYSFSDYSLGLPWGWPENQRFPSVAGTNWYYFSSQGFNPFPDLAKPGKPNITCYNDSGCGEDGWVGDPYCSGGHVYQDYRTWTCNNPGTLDSFCSSQDAGQMKEECLSGCESGACLVVMTQVYVSPEETMVSLGANFSVLVSILTPEDVFAGQFDFYFDPDIVNVLDVEEGDFLNQDGATTSMKMCEAGWQDLCPKINNTLGRITFANTRFDTLWGVSGSGSLAVIEMTSLGEGSSALGLENVLLSDNQIPPNPITPVHVANGSVSVMLLTGDVNGNCKVDIFDLAAVGLAFGSQPGDSNWNENADLIGDDIINIFDLATVGLNYGKICA